MFPLLVCTHPDVHKFTLFSCLSICTRQEKKKKEEIKKNTKKKDTYIMVYLLEKNRIKKDIKEENTTVKSRKPNEKEKKKKQFSSFKNEMKKMYQEKGSDTQKKIKRKSSKQMWSKTRSKKEMDSCKLLGFICLFYILIKHLSSPKKMFFPRFSFHPLLQREKLVLQLTTILFEFLKRNKNCWQSSSSLFSKNKCFSKILLQNLFGASSCMSFWFCSLSTLFLQIEVIFHLSLKSLLSI